MGTNVHLTGPVCGGGNILLCRHGSTLATPKVTDTGGFNLVNICVLRPTRPLPPLSHRSLRFRRLRAMCVFQLQRILSYVARHEGLRGCPMFLRSVLSRCKSLGRHIGFGRGLHDDSSFVCGRTVDATVLMAVVNTRLELPGRGLHVLAATTLLCSGKCQGIPQGVLRGKVGSLSSSSRSIVRLSLRGKLIPLSVCQGSFSFFPHTLTLVRACMCRSRLRGLTATPSRRLRRVTSVLHVTS